MRWLAAVAGAALLAVLVIVARSAYREVWRFRHSPPPQPWRVEGTPLVRPEQRPKEQAPPSPPPEVEPSQPEPPCPIVPRPKLYKEAGRTAELLWPGAAIVLGDHASEPERYAAQCLQAFVDRRFKRKLPILAEKELRAPEEGPPEGGTTNTGASVRQAILLGQRATNAWLERLCTEKGVELSAVSPGADGFVIELVEDKGRPSPGAPGPQPGEGRQAILIAGGNDRGVIYGAHAFCDLLAPEGTRVVFPVASVRDWPSIAWRGRPIDQMRIHLVPGTFDAYARYRLNFLDIRDAPDGHAGLGTPPGFRPDEAAAREVLRQARRRAMFVYGTVACSTEPDRLPAVLETFDYFAKLGVDGLWISFDDAGAKKGWETLIERVLAFAKERGFSGRALAITPPMGSYEHIATDFNRAAAKLPGLADITWFFTRVPAADNVAAARRIGLSRLPAWWHNYPRFALGGFLHAADGGLPLGPKGRLPLDPEGCLPYFALEPLATGWGNPTYDDLRDADQHTDTVMIWCVWSEDYLAGALGLWAWWPEKHDWGRTRAAIYARVFGPSLAPTAAAFDDALAHLKSLFILPCFVPMRPGVDWPPRLKNPADLPRALQLLDQLDAHLKKLQAQAPAETLLDPARLAERYLEPMRATVDAARTMAALETPDRAYAELERRVGDLMAAGKTTEAEVTFRSAGDTLLAQVDKVAAALRGFKGIEGEGSFAAFWRARLAGFSRTVRADAERLKKLAEGFNELAPKDLARPLEGLGNPPEGAPLVARGADEWQRGPALLNGPWAMGLVGGDGGQALGIACPGWGGGEVFHFLELAAELPVPAFEGRLALDAFVGAGCGGERTRGVRSLQLWAGGRLLWEHDAAEPRAGWLSLEVTPLVLKRERLDVRFRIVHRRSVERFESHAFLGPLRLRPLAGR